MTWGIVLQNSQKRPGCDSEGHAVTYPLRATTHRAPLVGSRRNAKSRDGSHISVSVFGRYPPMECVRLFVTCIDLRRRLELPRRYQSALRSGRAKQSKLTTPRCPFSSRYTPRTRHPGPAHPPCYQSTPAGSTASRSWTTTISAARA